MTAKTKELVLRGLTTLRGDDLYRAEAAFRHCTPKEMQEQYGQSGQTRQQIIDAYRSWTAVIDAAIAEVNAL